MEKKDEKRIVFLIGSMTRGGAERVISVLANEYAKKGWNVDILTLLDDKVGYILNDNITVIPICNSKKSRIAQIPNWIKAIRKHMIEKKPSKVVSFVARINIITLISCLGLNQEIIISERNDPKSDGRSILTRIGTYIFYPLAKSIVFQTKWAQECFPKKIQAKGEIIPNPINVNEKARDIKEKKVVSVGRLMDQKNQEMLINAFKNVLDKYPEYCLFIYGEGPLREKLTKQIQMLGIEGNVFLPGNIENVHEKIADAEVFVLSSNYEGLSNALLEAMIIGLPCISTNCSGISEIIINGDNGILVPIGDVKTLSKEIIKLIENKELAKDISEKSILSTSDFKTEIVFKKWEDIISR